MNHIKNNKKPEHVEVFDNKSIFVLCFAGIILFSILLHLPFLSVPLERDEGEYAYIARLLLNGGVPYKEAFNQKPPGIFFIYSIIFLTLGESIEAIHVGVLICAVFTLIAFYALSRKFFGKGVSLLAMASLAVFTSEPAYLGHAANTEIFLLLPMILGLYFLFEFFDRRTAPLLFLSGIMAGTAFMIKQVVAFPIILMVGYLIYWGIKQRFTAIKYVLIYGFGLLLPFLLFIFYFWYQGALHDFIDFAFLHNFRYSRSTPWENYLSTLKIRMAKFLVSDAILFIFGAIGLLFIISKKLKKKEIFWLWLFLFSLLSVSVGGYFRSHYFILLHPAMAVLTAVGLSFAVKLACSHLRIISFVKNAVAFVVVFAVLCSPVFFQRKIYFEKDPNRISREMYGYNPFVEALEIGRYLKENTDPDDKIFIFGSEPEILFYAQRASATRYIIFYPLMSGFASSFDQQKEAFRELSISKPKYIVFLRIDSSFETKPSTERFIHWEVSKYLKNYELEGIVKVDEQHYWAMTFWGDEARKRASESGIGIEIYRRI